MSELKINEKYLNGAIEDIVELSREYRDEYKEGEDISDYERWKSLEHVVEILHSINGDRLPSPNIDIDNIQLVLAAITGDIYMADIEEEGIMNTLYRRVATKDVQTAMAEWFIKNGEKEVEFPGHGTLKWVPEV